MPEMKVGKVGGIGWAEPFVPKGRGMVPKPADPASPPAPRMLRDHVTPLRSTRSSLALPERRADLGNQADA